MKTEKKLVVQEPNGQLAYNSELKLSLQTPLTSAFSTSLHIPSIATPLCCSSVIPCLVILFLNIHF